MLLCDKQRSNGSFLFVTLVWLVYLTGLFLVTFTYIEDDAYIHLEFARNVVAGNGFAFKGNLTFGDTSPLWVLLTAGLYRVVGDWLWAIKGMTIIGTLICVSGAFVLARKVARNSSRARILAYLFPTLVIINPYFVFWVASGMEAVLALGITFWLAWLSLFADRSPRKLAIFSLVAGLAPLIRPELGILALQGVVILGWRGYTSSKAGTIRFPPNRLFLYATLLVLPTLLWSVYAWSSFGTIIPSTVAAKRLLPETGPVTLSTGLVRLGQLLLVGFGLESAIVGVAGVVFVTGVIKNAPAGLLAEEGDHGHKAKVICLLLWPASLFVLYLLNLTATQTRYVLVVGPFITLAALWTLDRWLNQNGLGKNALHRVLFSAVVGLIAVAYAGVDLASVRFHLANKMQLIAQIQKMTEFVRFGIPHDAPIAVYGMGQIAFETPNPIIDQGGLTMPDAQSFLTEPQQMFEWAKKRGARYFVSGAPLSEELEPVFQVTTPYVGWKFGETSYAERGTLVLSRLVAR